MTAGRGEQVWAALGTVLDPEIDEPITDLGFVASCEVTGSGVVHVVLRLPTFFCAPNFTFLMVADAQDAVRQVPGVTEARVVVEGHHAAEEINRGLAAGAAFEDVFDGEVDGGLEEIRRTFLTKAALAGQDRVARPLVDGGATPQDLVDTTLGSVPDSTELRRLRQRRAALGLPSGDDAPLLVDTEGRPVALSMVPLHLRRARLTRVGLEANGDYCTRLLRARYPELDAAPAPAAGSNRPQEPQGTEIPYSRILR